MPFTDQILNFGSCSIVGMAKNCGKTVVLNHILAGMRGKSICPAVTSIGVDGETIDSITLTAKPEIVLDKGTLFATSETHYNQRRLVSEIVDSTGYWSPLGKIVIGRVLEKGRVIISGPSDTQSTKSLIARFHQAGAGLVLVDGALSRKTSASPVITDSLVLCTGAALSLNLVELVRQTLFTYQLISLKRVENNKLIQMLEKIDSCIWGISDENELVKIADSVFDLKKSLPEKLKSYSSLFFTGMLTSNILEAITAGSKPKEVIIPDFTKIFVSPVAFRKFTEKGNQIKVLHKTELIAVCVNPTSPSGHVLNSGELVDKLQKHLEIGVYDVKKIC